MVSISFVTKLFFIIEQTGTKGKHVIIIENESQLSAILDNENEFLCYLILVKHLKHIPIA